MIIRALTHALCGLLFLAPLAAAQAPGTSDFCAMAPAETLAALEGNWTFRQASGRVGAGVRSGVLPGVSGAYRGLALPAQRPVQMNLRWERTGVAAVLSGQGQEMVMVPADAVAVSDVVGPFSAAEADGSGGSASGCNFPILIGTNHYVLPGQGAPTPLQQEAYLGTPFYFCSDNALWLLLEKSIVIGAGGFGAEVDPANRAGCGEARPPGEMDMQIVVRFQSASSGSGFIYFFGKDSRSIAAASAPITMTR